MLGRYEVVRVGMGDFYVDLITKVADIDYDAAQQDRYLEKISDVEIPVAGLETMIKLKQGYREIDRKTGCFLKARSII